MRGLFSRILIFILVLGGSADWWLRTELDTPYYGAPTPQAFVEIPRGSSSERISRLLQDAGVLHDRVPLALYLRWSGKGQNLKAGEYRFDTPLTPPQVAEKLEQGEVYYHTLTIPEGLTAQETIAHIAESGFATLPELERALRRTEWIRDLSPEAPGMEGYLFPETYRISQRAAAEHILQMMVDRFREVFGRLRQDHPIPRELSVHEIVTLASLVEKEVKTSSERNLVASVLMNRLRTNMPLGCDPTVIYALKLAGRYDGNIRRPDLHIDSPYNTYVKPGLPPGPIANPGEDSLRAALAPANTDYLYFVARNDGTHEFSKDLKSHERAVTRFQRSPGRK